MVVAFTTSFALWACGGGSSDARPVPPPSTDIVARVNGAELHAIDVEILERQGDHAQRNPGRGGDVTQAAVETLVRNELRAQRAVELGLDRDPKFQTELKEKEAALAAWRRESLADLLIAKQTPRIGEITDGEARAYFHDHAAQLATETHVMQILMRDRTAIDAVEAALGSGRGFEDVAAEHFPGLPDATKRPWDLGYLRWAQLPEPWKAVIETIPSGGRSGVIAGAGNRYWILYVVDRRNDPSLDFDRARADVIHTLQVDRQSKAVGEIDRALRQNAQVDLAK
jgi:hypothetical protein